MRAGARRPIEETVMATPAAQQAATFTVAVFDGTRLLGHRRFADLAQSVEFMEHLRDAGFRTLPLTPGAEWSWARDHAVAA